MRRFLMFLAVAMLAAPAPMSALSQERLTQANNSAPAITKPIWLVPPPLANLPSRFEGHVPPNVTLTCRVSNGALITCGSVEPTPEAFLNEALRSAEVSRIAPYDRDGQGTEGREIVVAVGFPIPVMLEPPAQPAEPPANLIMRPVWLARPTPEDFEAAYPQQARRVAMEGRIRLECVVGADGRITCRDTSTSAEMVNAGFLQAAQSLVPRFQMAPEDGAGQPTAGRLVRIFVHFRPRDP